MKAFLIFVILYGLFPLFFILKFRKEMININCIYPFILVVFISSLYEFFGSIILKISLEDWYLIYKTISFISILYFYYSILNKKYKLFFILLIFLFILKIVMTFTIWSDKFYFDISSYFNVFQTITILVLSILWFRKILIDLEFESLLDNPIYFFVSGLLIYYLGTVFVYLIGSYIYFENKELFQYYWLLNIILNLVLRTLLIVGVWKARVH